MFFFLDLIIFFKNESLLIHPYCFFKKQRRGGLSDSWKKKKNKQTLARGLLQARAHGPFLGPSLSRFFFFFLFMFFLYKIWSYPSKMDLYWFLLIIITFFQIHPLIFCWSLIMQWNSCWFDIYRFLDILNKYSDI